MKKLLISLTVLFSIFLFSNNIKAASSNVYDMSSWIDVEEFTLPNGINPDDYNIVIWRRSSTLGYRIIYWSKQTTNIYINTMGTGGTFPNLSYICSYNNMSSYYNINYYDETTAFSKIFKNSRTGSGSSFSADKLIYSNVNIYYVYSNHTNIWFNINNVQYGPSSYNVTFHLNGGIANDRNCIDDGNICNIVDMQYEDYTSPIQADELFQYLIHQTVTKENMQFDGWYYDSKLTQKVNSNDVLTEDCDFYAKWVYKNVEDFLANTTFNTHTFDTNYEYAIISLNDSENRDIYLGLNFIDYSLEIYKYLKNNNTYIDGATICLTPYYSKDNKYYYWLKNPLDNDYEVLIIPKEKFKDNNYEFLLTTNAYVSYTNDLTAVVIKDDDGNDLTTDLSDSYDYSQNALINSENDILEIFKNLGNNGNSNVFQYLNQTWNMFKRSPLFTYFNMLIIGSIIILIVRAAKRH